MARCSVEYQGRLTTELPEAVRLLMIKGDGTLLIHTGWVDKLRGIRLTFE